MLKIIATLATAAMLAGLSTPAAAAPCKDAKGRFVKCPEKVKAPVRCKDAKGKFAKCGSPGAKPA